MDFLLLLLTAFGNGTLVKAVFSKPTDKTALRTVVTPRAVGGGTVFQAETFRADGKAIHENIPPEDADRLRALISAHGQANLITSVGSCELRTSKSGKTALLGGEKLARVCDLCCGKSYLSFAAYHYFANVLGRTVRMTGVDLKPDVIDRCNLAARALGWGGLEFLCGDVSRYDAGGHVHLVISLHACDTATDLVLSRAVRWGADAILSTPCCHHELNHTLNCPALGFIGAHSMLRQKLCDAATDALRLKYLEASGYSVAALELIDPEETPKNILLRGLRDRSFDPQSDRARRLWAEYETAKRFLVGENAHVQEALSPQTETEQPRLSS